MNADRSPSPLARVRWANLVRLLALPAVVLVVACWPRLSTRAPRLPDATARPVTIPPPAPARRPTGHAPARAPQPRPHRRPRTASRHRRAAARPSSGPRPRPSVPARLPPILAPAPAPSAGEFDLESG
jgi:hypothetical protein